MSLKRKAQATIEEKYDIIKRYETDKNCTHALLSIETGYPRVSISRWCGVEKVKIVKLYVSSITSSKRKRFRYSKNENIDEALYEWFKEKRAMNIAVNGPILMEKAEDFACLYNIGDFKSNNDWFDRWKKRYNISFLKMNGESCKVDKTTTDD